MTRRLSLLLLGAALLAGCGGGHAPRPKPRRPHLPGALAGPWRSQADAVAAALAAGDGCLALQRADALRADVVAAVDARRVPPRFQEPLVGAVNDLADRITCAPPAPPVPERGPPPGHGKGHDHGHGRGRGGD